MVGPKLKVKKGERKERKVEGQTQGKWKTGKEGEGM